MKGLKNLEIPEGRYAKEQIRTAIFEYIEIHYTSAVNIRQSDMLRSPALTTSKAA
jgi:hypothetical protein